MTFNSDDPAGPTPASPASPSILGTPETPAAPAPAPVEPAPAPAPASPTVEDLQAQIDAIKAAQNSGGIAPDSDPAGTVRVAFDRQPKNADPVQSFVLTAEHKVEIMWRYFETALQGDRGLIGSLARDVLTEMGHYTPVPPTQD